MPSVNEVTYFRSIEGRLDKIRDFLDTTPNPKRSDASEWYSFLSEIKSLQGNPNNDISFIATYLAKKYLEDRFEVHFDAAEKPQGAPGLDIDVITSSGERIIAEIKTTYPYKANDLGAQQANSFRKDFKKLARETASHKFFFITEKKTFELMKLPKYRQQLVRVHTVLLTTGEIVSG